MVNLAAAWLEIWGLSSTEIQHKLATMQEHQAALKYLSCNTYNAVPKPELNPYQEMAAHFT